MERIGAVRRDLVELALRFLLPFVHTLFAVVLRPVAVHHRLSLRALQRPCRGNGSAPERVEPRMGLDAQQAFQRAKKGDGVIGWSLDRSQRTELLLQFPPKFSEVVADHVTLAAKVARNAELPGYVDGWIVGRVDDGAGVEAMVVALDGASDRPDGSTYHLTGSLGPGRRARESNDVIAKLGWEKIELPMPVRLTPARWP